MNLLAKVLIGTAVVATTGATTGAIIAVVVDKKEHDKAQKKVDEATSEIAKAKAVVARNDRDEKSIIGRIKKFVQKKVIKFLAWVALHMEQIEAASAVIGLGSACFSIASAVRDFKRGNDLSNQITDMQEDIKLIRYYQDEDAKAINHNNKVFATSLEHICDATGVDGKELKDAIDNCDPGFLDNNDLMNTLDAIKKDKKTA